MNPPMHAPIVAKSCLIAVSHIETVAGKGVFRKAMSVAWAPNPRTATGDLVPYPIPQPGCGCPTATPTPPSPDACRHGPRSAVPQRKRAIVMARQRNSLLCLTHQAQHKGGPPCVTSQFPRLPLRPSSRSRLAAIPSASRPCSGARPASAPPRSPAAIWRLAPWSARAPASRLVRPVWSTAGADAQPSSTFDTDHQGRPARAGRPFCMSNLSLKRPPCSTRS